MLTQPERKKPTEVQHSGKLLSGFEGEKGYRYEENVFFKNKTSHERKSVHVAIKEGTEFNRSWP